MDDTGHAKEGFWSGFFTEFSEETVLHGFVYLLPNKGAFWALILLAFSAITVQNLASQIEDFIQNPIAVSDSRVFPTSMEFPTVSICNTLPYRVSAIRPLGSMHEALNAIYKTPSLNSTAARQYNDVLSQITNVSEYFRAIAPQQENLILKCEFLSVLCDIERDFHATITPYGVCYEFNSIGTQSLPLHVTNPNQKLNLILNAETYEAMRGPYTTFGVNVFIFPFGKPDYSNQNSPMLSVYSNIALYKQEVNFLKDYTCGTKTLKYFAVYSRLNCQQEMGYDLAIEKCSCIPVLIHSSRIPRSLNLRMCDLAQHYMCIGPANATLAVFIKYINNTSAQNKKTGAAVDETVCPKECNTVQFKQATTQAEIAWHRLEPVININKTHFGNILHTAQEVNQRYSADNNVTFTTLIDKVLHATDKITMIYEFVKSNFKCRFPTIPAQLPDSTIFDASSVHKMLETMKAIGSSVNTTFASLNNSLVLLERLAQNQTQLDYLKLIDISPEFEDDIEDLNELFLITNGRAYLTILNDWVRIISGLALFFPENLFSETSKFNTFHRLNASFYTSTNSTLLSGEQKVLINKMKDNLMFLGLRSNLSCWLMPDTVDLPKKESLLDLMSCLFIEYTDLNMLNQLGVNLVKILPVLKKNDKTGAKIKARCHQLLCEVTDSEKNCTLPFDRWQDLLVQATTSLKQTTSICSRKAISLNEIIDTMSNEVATILQSEFKEQKYSIVAIYNALSHMENSPLSEASSNYADFPNIQGAVGSYEQNHSIFKTLCQFEIRDVKPYMEQTFGPRNDKIEHAMHLRQSNLMNAKKAVETILVGRNESIHLMVNILARELLGWTNESTVDQNFELIKACVDEMLNETNTVLNELPGARLLFSNKIEQWHAYAVTYLEQLQIDQKFLMKNILVVDIAYSEIGYTVIQQSLAYDFWSLMSDIGGAASLWLGFSVVFFVQCGDMIIRRCIGKPVKKRIAKKWPAKSASILNTEKNLDRKCQTNIEESTEL